MKRSGRDSKISRGKQGRTTSGYTVAVIVSFIVTLAIVTIWVFHLDTRDDNGEGQKLSRQKRDGSVAQVLKETKKKFEEISTRFRGASPQEDILSEGERRQEKNIATEQSRPKQDVVQFVGTKSEQSSKQLWSHDLMGLSGDPNRRKRIAYAITITKDGFFQDGAAVLAYSIYSVSKNSGYDVSLVAFVHPNVTTSRPVLRKLGYHVIVAPTPINTSAIPWEFLRDHIDKNGCCGATELIKLNSYRLMQYDRVIHLDADTYLLNSIDELLERNYSLIYTTDPNMATYKKEECQPAQGGFLVMRPSIDDYLNLINIELTTEFSKGKGWNRSTIGWFWGGMTVQGILPYYYNRVTRPGRSQKVDRCYYNTMADTDECTKQTLDEIKSAHFTVCQKPWNCYKGFVNNLCGALHKRWFELRKKAEEFFQIPVNNNPCPGVGPKYYRPMTTQDAKPHSFFKPDDSPDRLPPIGNTGFRPGTIFFTD